jgi:hypothetical protein
MEGLFNHCDIKKGKALEPFSRPVTGKAWIFFARELTTSL